jgi:uncharacterized protein (DUF885 family)
LAFLALCAIGVCATAADVHDLDTAKSSLAPMLERYAVDRDSLTRTYKTELSPAHRSRLKDFYNGWSTTLKDVNFDSLSQDGKIDYLLFKNHLAYEIRQLDLRARQEDEIASLIPFAKTIAGFDDARRLMEPLDSQKAAATLAAMAKQVADLQKNTSDLHPPKAAANRAAASMESLRNNLKNWFGYYNGYDPMFTWWVAQPYKETDQALDKYAKFIREKLAGIKPEDKTAIVGNPVGREALLAEIAYAMIPYTPEELIALARNELAWCDREMIRASREMGFGDEWHKAIDKVKDMHVEPGQQPDLIRKLALEGIDFVEKHDLVTVPPLAKETWGMQMMTPERQLMNPFFLGGDSGIIVSYPTDSMTYEQRMMSMRGNNIPFSRSTVFHELIPGHRLQAFMSARYRTYRRPFGTPFFSEGNAFYWEMLFWDMGFPRTPEERVGMLFWRMHRAARIMFSLSFHLGQMTPEQCVDFLVERVGHERDNAAGEVRRSFDGSYGPLYQCAYMLGALQFYALHKELVDSGKMTNRAFHDAILKENRIPVEMIRASLTGQKLTRDYQPGWRFYGPLPSPQ